MNVKRVERGVLPVDGVNSILEFCRGNDRVAAIMVMRVSRDGWQRAVRETINFHKSCVARERPLRDISC